MFESACRQTVHIASAPLLSRFAKPRRHHPRARRCSAPPSPSASPASLRRRRATCSRPAARLASCVAHRRPGHTPFSVAAFHLPVPPPLGRREGRDRSCTAGSLPSAADPSLLLLRWLGSAGRALHRPCALQELRRAAVPGQAQGRQDDGHQGRSRGRHGRRGRAGQVLRGQHLRVLPDLRPEPHGQPPRRRAPGRRAPPGGHPGERRGGRADGRRQEGLRCAEAPHTCLRDSAAAISL